MGTRGAVAAAALALALAGCGDADEPAGGGSPGPAPTATSTPAEQETVLPEPTPTVEPATGEALDVEGIRVRLPEGWRQVYDTPFADTGRGPRMSVMLTAVATEQRSLEASQRFFWDGKQEPRGFEAQDSVVMGGLTAYHYTAHTSRYADEHHVGMWDSGYLVEVRFNFPYRMGAERQQRIVDSVIASYESPRTSG